MIVRMVTQWFGLDTIADEELERLRRPTEIAITKATLYFEGKVKKKLTAIPARTGRVYGDHQASAPGEPPAPLSNDLRRSITHTPVVWDGDNASAEVGSSMPYARILELGGTIRQITSKGNARTIRILPRPYFSATWLEEEARIQAILDRAVKDIPVMGDIVPQVAEDGASEGRRDRSAAARRGWETRRRRRT